MIERLEFMVVMLPLQDEDLHFKPTTKKKRGGGAKGGQGGGIM